jgi:predicted O-methyltransferase YrrM
MNSYKYTENWFSHEGLDNLLPKNGDQEFHILEIGSFEGRSTVWFLENVLIHEKSTITCVDPWLNYNQDKDSFNSYGKQNQDWKFKDNNIKSTFLYNIIVGNHANKVNIMQGFSHALLPYLITNNKNYDAIFIDGNHTTAFVMTDAVMSWYLLKVQGIMIFDDYAWELNLSETLRPKKAVDDFISLFGDYLEVVHTGYRKVIRKIK